MDAKKIITDEEIEKRYKKYKLLINYNLEYLKKIIKEHEFISINSLNKYLKIEIKNVKDKLNLKALHDFNINYWIVRGWNEDYSRLKANEYLIEKSKRLKGKFLGIFQYQFWINKGYTENEAKNKVSEIQRKNGLKFVKKRKEHPELFSHMKSPMTKEFWLKKGMKEEDIEKQIKSQRKNSTEYWINKGFTYEEAKNNVSEYQKECTKKYNDNVDKTSYKYKITQNTHIEYWINKGFTYDESIVKLKERQTTFTKEKCIKKYGEVKGLEIWNKRQKKWIAKMFNKDTCMATGRSKSADEVIKSILDKITDDNIKSNILYGENEKFIYDNINKKPYRYDICYNKKIIEINGDFWHSNPKDFKADDIHRVTKKKCSDIWDYDKNKLNTAILHNYKVLVIWQSDYDKNKDEVINKCLNFLYESNT